MNRLIIIGNGFDLAHGLKTSYADFMLDYLKELTQPLIDGFPQYLSNSDDFIMIEIDDHASFVNNRHIINDINTLQDFYQKLYVSGLRIEGTTNFSKAILSQFNEYNWVDLENIYYSLLTIIVSKPESDRKKEIVILNEHLAFFKKKLIDYLIKIDTEFNLDEHSELKFAIENILIHGKPGSADVERTLILNFNYTSVIKKYVNGLNKRNIEHIQIHGGLDNPHSVVFGFGDELDKHYLDIEELNDNNFFEHIKSFSYFQNSNYQDLIKFLNHEDYEVYVLGHSLGLSDRTMFNQIFESTRLKRIFLYYYKKQNGSDDYTEKTHEISRHFKNKGRMRTIVKPKSSSDSMPQRKPKN